MSMEHDQRSIRIRILVFEDLPGIWIARALEHDVPAEGRSVEAAVRALLRIMRAHIDFDRRHNRDPLSSFRAAPQIYWTAFNCATPLAWASRLAGMLPLAAEVAAAVALERPRARPSIDVMNRSDPRPSPASSRTAHMR